MHRLYKFYKTRKTMEKTNVMRILTQKGIEFTAHEYDQTMTDGETIAQLLNESPESVFKTLVTVANTGEHYVFVIPVCCTLDLKKAAAAAGVKNIAMIKQKELLPLTGYIHGGCSPIGMKKPFPTFVEESATLCDKIYFSAGKVGYQVQIAPSDLLQLISAEYKDLV
jgi:Cys-tRNA(Pro)/Cys-tRNA(Cys) deacylase